MGLFVYLLFYFPELGQLSGLAAILRFPIQEPSDDDDSSTDSDEE